MKFMSNIFAKHGTQVTSPIDYFSMTFLEMCNTIKKHSQEQSWVAQNSPDAIQLADISFDQVHVVALQDQS